MVLYFGRQRNFIFIDRLGLEKGESPMWRIGEWFGRMARTFLGQCRSPT